jgi:hypothetical protein
MTSWGYLIIAGVLFVGLKNPATAKYRYLSVCLIVILAVSYAAVRQHTY